MLFGLFVFCLAASWVHAGGGPENLFLVVNSNDPDSRTIANHYCYLRHIPVCNVFEIDWRGSNITAPISAFRESILDPVFDEIKRRKLTQQIDYIVYSSGFPYGIDFSADVGSPRPHAVVGHVGSITGLTYLNQSVRSRDESYAIPPRPPNYLGPVEELVAFYKSNNYATYDPANSRGFRSTYQWSDSGQLSQRRGKSYHISTMLGYTAGPRGNTVDEVIRYLRHAALADGVQPKGTIYFMQNNDVRSTTRSPAFASTVAQLERQGVQAEVITGEAPKDGTGIMPRLKDDVMGLVAGYSAFNWPAYQNRILPGAICEHLTSFGGILKPGTGQTPLTIFLRYGAAGASGTVLEPYSLQVKFPHPTIHCRYASGCSLGESFYQSLASPYQLLIVGDPLCRPWAKIPAVRVDGIQDGQTVSKVVTIRPSSDRSNIKVFQLFIDGRHHSNCAPGDSLSLDTLKLADGYHDIRVVATVDSAIESQGRAILLCNVNNRKRSLECEPIPAKNIPMDDRFMVRVNAPGAQQVLVFHRRKPLAKMNRASGEVLIDPRDLGAGPVQLTVVAKKGAGVANGWLAKPLFVNILPSQREAPRSTSSPVGTPPPAAGSRR